MAATGPDARWQQARLVVFGTDPFALETTVNQLEAQGAQPAVLFTLPLAVEALDSRRPDVVVADLGTGDHASPEARAFLDHLEARAQNAVWHPPVVLLGAPAALGETVSVDGLPVQFVTRDTPAQVARALDGALAASSLARPAPAIGRGRLLAVAGAAAILLALALLLLGRSRSSGPSLVSPATPAPTTAPLTGPTTGLTTGPTTAPQIEAVTPVPNVLATVNALSATATAVARGPGGLGAAAAATGVAVPAPSPTPGVAAGESAGVTANGSPTVATAGAAAPSSGAPTSAAPATAAMTAEAPAVSGPPASATLAAEPQGPAPTATTPTRVVDRLPVAGSR